MNNKFMEAVMGELIDALPLMQEFHSRGGPIFNIFENIAEVAAQATFGPAGTQCAKLPKIGELRFPFFSMGAINSTHLFGLDELIIFAFYARNRRNYRRVADIGANIGLHSIILAKLGYEVEAFEPDEKHRELMARNFELNAVTNKIRIRPQAVSTSAGSLEFVRVLGNTTGSHIAGAKEAPYGELETIVVPTVDFCDVAQRVDLVKLDVEGHELEILAHSRHDDWVSLDAIIEVGTRKNATGIFEHLNAIKVNMFSQKAGWKKVVDISQMPTSHKEGSLFITCRDAMNWA